MRKPPTESPTETIPSRLPTALVLLLVFQWMLVLAGLGSLVVIIPVFWALGMGIASVRIVQRKQSGFDAAIFCHLLLQIVGWCFALLFFGIWAYERLSRPNQMTDLGLIVGLLWLPFLLPSLCGYFYLKRLRSQWFPQQKCEAAG